MTHIHVFMHMQFLSEIPFVPNCRVFRPPISEKPGVRNGNRVEHEPSYLKAQPHAAMLHICDGVFQSSCDAGKLPAMVCDAFSNMLVILLPILEYLSIFCPIFKRFSAK